MTEPPPTPKLRPHEPVSRTFWALFGFYAFICVLTAIEFTLACADGDGSFPIPSLESWAHISVEAFAVRALFGIVPTLLILAVSYRLRHDKKAIITLYLGGALLLGALDAAVMHNGGGAYLANFLPTLEGTLCAVRAR